MPHYSSRSSERLATCHDDLQRLFRDVVKRFDNTILSGHRTPGEQQELYAQGRTAPGRIVTYRDGVTSLSDHNLLPSLAVDATPYPIAWWDTNRMYFFAGWVLQTAYAMGINLQWGGDWNRDTLTANERFVDVPHFALILL